MPRKLSPRHSLHRHRGGRITAQDGAKLKSSTAGLSPPNGRRQRLFVHHLALTRNAGGPADLQSTVTQDTVESALRFGGLAGVTATPDPYYREVFYVLPLPGEPGALIIPGGTPAVKSDDRVTTGPDAASQLHAAGQPNGQPNTGGQSNASGQSNATGQQSKPGASGWCRRRGNYP